MHLPRRSPESRPAPESAIERFVEFVPDAIVGVGAGGQIVLVNEQAERVFGYDRAELIGSSIERLIPERFHAEHGRHRSRYFEDPRTRPMGAGLQLFGRRKDGTEFPAEISLSSIETEDGTLATAAVRDVSDRVAAQRKFEQFVEFAPDAIVGVSGRGEIVLVNQQAERVFGYDRAELVGLSIETLIPDRFHAEHGRHRSRYFEDPRTRPMGAGLQLFARRKDGSEFPAEISLSSIETEDGTLATAAVRDVSDRVAAEQERAALEAQLSQSQRLESVGQLAGGIAHDFNNLLGVILNCASFVARALPDEGELTEDVEEIRRAAERGAALTRQLLIFSRRDVVRPEVLALDEVISGMQSLLRRALGEHIELQLDLGAGALTVEIDRGQLEQVLLNLAVNARDAMRQGGQLRIVTSTREVAAGHPQMAAGTCAALTVSDTGSGMEPEVSARAFEPFFTTKRSGEGSGLGLAMVYGIVRGAGGDVAIRSAPGAGTSVEVLLPPAATRAAPTDEDDAPQRRAASGTILLVEDEPSLRRTIRRMLALAGYAVVDVSSGNEALQELERQARVDLLLTDILMPGMLGTELAQRVATAHPELPIGFMSGYSDNRPDVDPAAGSTVLEKPFTEDELLSFVGERLTR